MAAIEGGAVATLARRMEALEAEQLSLEQERQRLEREEARQRVCRPSAESVRALWGRFTELWEAATEAERAELMPLLVERVEFVRSTVAGAGRRCRGRGSEAGSLRSIARDRQSPKVAGSSPAPAPRQRPGGSSSHPAVLFLHSLTRLPVPGDLNDRPLAS